jgi:hypothetical protein
MYGTRKPDETLVFISMASPGEFARLAEEFPWATFYAEDDKADWGHAKREAGVERATKDYLGFFNDDDSYHPAYLEMLMAAAERADADAVYCDWSGMSNCGFHAGSSTSGNFIVRTQLAREVGYPGTQNYENDGVFINRVQRAALTIVKIPQTLYHHNHQ